MVRARLGALAWVASEPGGEGHIYGGCIMLQAVLTDSLMKNYAHALARGFVGCNPLWSIAFPGYVNLPK